MRQVTLASQDSFEKYGRKSKREQFLETMEAVVPWSELEALIEPHYPKAGNGRQRVGLSIMLRVYFLQQWFNLSDPGVEDAFYESPALRRFAGVDLGRAPAPDETTVLRFRHLLEEHELCGKILDTVNLYLESKGIRISTGTIVDATIIHAPSSTKNSSGSAIRRCTRHAKGSSGTSVPRRTSAWMPGKVTCIRCVLRRPVCPTCICCPDLLHGEEKKVWGDGGYQGQADVIREAAPEAQDMTCRRTQYKDGVDEEARRKNRTKSKVRAKVEWPFRILKRVFGFTKVRYRGLKKNHEWLLAAFALVNLYLHRRRLVPLAA
jgi:Transposase and inactivated derivatives, IS5 family